MGKLLIVLAVFFLFGGSYVAMWFHHEGVAALELALCIALLQIGQHHYPDKP